MTAISKPCVRRRWSGKSNREFNTPMPCPYRSPANEFYDNINQAGCQSTCPKKVRVFAAILRLNCAAKYLFKNNLAVL
jgi:hypothetical protein